MEAISIKTFRIIFIISYYMITIYIKTIKIIMFTSIFMEAFYIKTFRIIFIISYYINTIAIKTIKIIMFTSIFMNTIFIKAIKIILFFPLKSKNFEKFSYFFSSLRFLILSTALRCSLLTEFFWRVNSLTLFCNSFFSELVKFLLFLIVSFILKILSFNLLILLSNMSK